MCEKGRVKDSIRRLSKLLEEGRVNIRPEDLELLEEANVEYEKIRGSQKEGTV